MRLRGSSGTDERQHYVDDGLQRKYECLHRAALELSKDLTTMAAYIGALEVHPCLAPHRMDQQSVGATWSETGLQLATAAHCPTSPSRASCSERGIAHGCLALMLHCRRSSSPHQRRRDDNRGAALTPGQHPFSMCRPCARGDALPGLLPLQNCRAHRHLQSPLQVCVPRALCCSPALHFELLPKRDAPNTIRRPPLRTHDGAMGPCMPLVSLLLAGRL